MSRKNVQSNLAVREKIGGASAPSTKDLIVLACYENFFFCRERGPNGRMVTFKTKNKDEVPGAIITVNSTQEISRAKYPEISGTIVSVRYCAKDLGLEPVPMGQRGKWSPEDECWGKDGEEIPDWYQSIAKRGKRPLLLFEPDCFGPKRMDAVRRMTGPFGDSSYSLDDHPINVAGEFIEEGNVEAGKKILMDLLAKDLGTIDAYDVLGGIELENNPQRALLYYQMGVLIGELSLEKQLPDPVIPYSWLDNRAFLRCFCGIGLCAWKSKNLISAKDIFLKLLSYNPDDNQGVRYMLRYIEKGKSFDEFNRDELNQKHMD